MFVDVDFLCKDNNVKYTFALRIALCECEVWSFTLGNGPRLRLFENKVPKRIFGSKMGAITGGWRKFHKEEFYTLVFIVTCYRGDQINGG